MRTLIFSCAALGSCFVLSGQRMTGHLQGGLGLPADPLASVSILQAALLGARAHTRRAERCFRTWSSLVLGFDPRI